MPFALPSLAPSSTPEFDRQVFEPSHDRSLPQAHRPQNGLELIDLSGQPSREVCLSRSLPLEKCLNTFESIQSRTLEVRLDAATMGVESIALNAKAGQSREKDTQTTFAAVRV
jgi:hypothetical protein